MLGTRFRITIAGTVLATCLVAACLLGQEITGTISGTVTDSTGAVIPEASVTVTNINTKAARSTTTTSAGVFFFTSLPIGDYVLKVTKERFRQHQHSGIHLDVNEKLSFNIALEVGAVTQAITVTSEAPPLETSTGTVANLVGSEQTEALPLNGRAFNQLLDLVPGVAPDSGAVGGGVGLFSDTAVSVNGNQSNSNTFLVDGLYNEDNGSNANLLVTPSVDSLAEFNVLRNNYSSEFGGATGGIVNIITKSGTQTFHGDLFDFLRNDALDSANFFENATGTKKGKLRLNNFGGTLGGPFWIPGHYNQDKTKDFFFASTEFRREIRGNVAHDTVPSPRQRQGILDPGCVSTPTPCTIQPADPFEDPLSGESNVDPSQIDPNGAALLARYPLPNANFAQNGFNYFANEPTVTNVDQDTYRWDHYISEKARVMVRYMRMSQSLNGINGQLWGDDNFPSVNSDWIWVGRNAVLHVTNTLSPRLVNDFEFGYSHNHISFQTGASSDKTLASRSGFTYTELFPATSGSFPTLWGVESFGAIVHTAPFFNKTDNWLFKDDLAFTFGKHNVKAGTSILLLRKMEPANGGDDEDAGTVSFNTFSDLLLGNLLNYSEEQTLNPVRGRYKNVAFYGQDDYKVSRGLTLNLGLRWQYLSPIRSANNNIANFDPGRYDPTKCSPAAFTPDGLADPALCDLTNGIITSATSGVDKALVRRHLNQWEPRVGFAWLPLAGNERFVVRGGFGIYHGRDAGSQTSALGRQPPFDRVASLNNLTFSQLAPGQLSPFNSNLPQPPVELSALDIGYLNPESYQYSLGYQWEFTRKTTAEVNYVGSRQIHLGRNRDINQPPPQFQSDIFDGTVDANTVRNFLGYSIINLNERAGDSRYNSLQVFVNHRVDRFGLQLQTAYTYSRSVANANNKDSEGHANPIQDAFHPQFNKAVADQNLPHSLVFNYIWNLPFFKDTKGWRGAALDGWELVGITGFRTGLPLTVCVDREIDGTLSEACQRPDLIANSRLDKGARTIDRFFNTNAYVLQQPGTFGNAGRNMFTGPGINNWNFSIFKNFRVPWFGKGSSSLAGESANLQFRAEFFNLFNHTIFSDVNTSFVPQTDANGNLLVGQPADPSSGFGAVTGARAPREIQFALKFIF